jgi:hypothetical protein
VNRITRGIGILLGVAGLVVGSAASAAADIKVKVKCGQWTNVYPGERARQILVCETVSVNTKTRRATMSATYYARWNSVGEGAIDIMRRKIDFAPTVGGAYCNPPAYTNYAPYRFRHMKTGVSYYIRGGSVTITAPRKKGKGCTSKKNYHPLHGSVATSAFGEAPYGAADKGPGYATAGVIKF